MKISIQQTHHRIGDFEKIIIKLQSLGKHSEKILHLFPECYLSGYPIKDLCFQKIFIDDYLACLRRIDLWSQSLAPGRWSAILGGLDYQFDDRGEVSSLTNAAFFLSPGVGLKKIYDKILLPNYDIFDEKRYFIAGQKSCILREGDRNIAVQICEDMWSSNQNQIDPVEKLFQDCEEGQIRLDLIVNLSASPFYSGHQKLRRRRAREISDLFSCPFVYVNRVGGEDELLFDGRSFYLFGDETLKELNSFKEDSIILDLKDNLAPMEKDPSLHLNKKIVSLPSKDEDLEMIFAALQFGIQEYSRKVGLTNLLVAVSGGIDSALVLLIAHSSLQKGQTLTPLHMNGLYSDEMSYRLSEKLCQNLNLQLETLPIKFIHRSLVHLYEEYMGGELQNVSDENIQSRLRGLLLYAHSNSKDLLVLNTSNKSEIALGYSTLYGDSVGAISVLGDLLKTEVYALARHVNSRYGHPIPEGIMMRAPSAELRENQKDLDTLPPYERLDPLLEKIIEGTLSKNSLLSMADNQEELEKILKLYKNAEYKRRQFCPILKVGKKSFGFGHRTPLV